MKWNAKVDSGWKRNHLMTPASGIKQKHSHTLLCSTMRYLGHTNRRCFQKWPPESTQKLLCSDTFTTQKSAVCSGEGGVAGRGRMSCINSTAEFRCACLEHIYNSVSLYHQKIFVCVVYVCGSTFWDRDRLRYLFLFTFFLFGLMSNVRNTSAHQLDHSESYGGSPAVLSHWLLRILCWVYTGE